MKKVLAFGASTSRNSINRQLVQYALGQVSGLESRLLDLNDFEMPLFSVDRERESGYPAKSVQFRGEIEWADGLLISLAEHNGSYTAAFKNTMDWSSRVGPKLWMEKPMYLLSTSPGGRGGKNAMDAALAYFPRMGARVVASFSLPSFKLNFVDGRIQDPDLEALFRDGLQKFEAAMQEVEAE